MVTVFLSSFSIPNVLLSVNMRTRYICSMTFYIMSHSYGIQIDMAKYHPTISQHTWQMTDNNALKLSGIPSFLSFLLFFHSILL